LFQILCYISMILGHIMSSGTIIYAAFVGDIIGAVMCPMALAITAMVVGLRDEKRVIRMYPNAAAATGATGLIRGALFLIVSGLSGFVGAMKYLVISFLLLTLWFLIFDVSANTLNKGTKFNRNKK
ncbi:MAG: hypothetical protein ACI4SS_02710, partial [Clostridia bacterium]